MAERAYVEQIAWDTDSIVDAALDVSVEILKREGTMTQESRRRVGTMFGLIRSQPFSDLRILAPDEKTPLIQYLPPLEFSVNKLDLDEGERSAEASIIVVNPIIFSDDREQLSYLERSWQTILSVTLQEVSRAYGLRCQEDLRTFFPKERFGRSLGHYNVPLIAA